MDVATLAVCVAIVAVGLILADRMWPYEDDGPYGDDGEVVDDEVAA